MRKKSEFNPRALMEQAIEVMRQSVDELRGDAKACPKVGAVLLKPDGTIETAYRGELRNGDHAEYTLLERKNRDRQLEGSILFATLEPCAPGARHPPKMSCSERIMHARIKEVWIGIEDPDPTVDRKGIKYLQDAGVTVHMFDRDLQEIIQAENEPFITKAIERAVVARDSPSGKVTLSPLERTIEHTTIEDLSREALDSYRSTVGIEDEASSSTFQRRLALQGLLQFDDPQFTPTGYGLLLFGKEPRTALPQAGLLGTIHYPDGTEEVRNFEGPQVFAPEAAIQWLRDKLPNPIERSEARRREANDSLFRLLREGIVNALIHRDYAIAGAKCQLVVTPDTIVVMSPGLPVEPISLEQMQTFSAPMLSRNPALHYIFARMAMAEERGLGLKALRDRSRDLALPLPRYTWNDPYLVLTLFRNQQSAIHTLSEMTLESLSKAEQRGWQWVATQGTVTTSEYGRAMGIPNRTALNHLTHFTALGLLRQTGTGRASRYEVI